MALKNKYYYIYGEKCSAWHNNGLCQAIQALNNIAYTTVLYTAQQIFQKLPFIMLATQVEEQLMFFWWPLCDKFALTMTYAATLRLHINLAITSQYMDTRPTSPHTDRSVWCNSTSAFPACHQCYCAGLSLAWSLNLRVLVCGIF